MKNEKIKIGIIIIVVCVILLGIGILFISNKHNGSKVQGETNSSGEQINNEEGKTTSNMYEEHCLNDFCTTVNSFKLKDDEGGGSISFTITNKSTKAIDGGIKKIRIKYNDETEEMLFSYFSLDAKESLDVTIDFYNTNLINATDYELLEPTSEESNIYNND
jgi:hypothetical protein